MPTHYAILPPPPKGQKGVSFSSLSSLPPPPTGQKGLTLQELQKPVTLPQKPVEKGYFSRVGEQYQKAGEGIIDVVKKGAQELSRESITDFSMGSLGRRMGSLGQTGIQTAGQFAGALFAPVTEAVKPALEATGLAEPIGRAIGAIAETPQVKKGIEFYKTLDPETQKNLGAAFNIGTALTGQKLISKTSSVSPSVLGVAKTGVGVVAKSGLKTVAKLGGVTSKVGKVTYKSAITPTVAEAERILAHEASKAPLLQRILGKGKDVVPTAAPITRADTALKFGIVGTEKQIGVQAKRNASTIWKDKIAPALAKSKDVVTKDEMFAPIIKRIADTVEPSRKRALQNAFDAIKEDYAGIIKVPIQEAQKIKEGLAQFTPSKVFRGQEVASEVRMLQADMAGAIRKKINTSLKDIDAQAAYRDYGNLKELQKVGVKAISESGLKAGFGNFVSSMWDAAVAPIKTIGGLTLYKVGNKMQFWGEKGLKTFGDHMKSKGYTKPNMTALPRQPQIVLPKLKSQSPLPPVSTILPKKAIPKGRGAIPATKPSPASQAIAKGLTEDDWVKGQTFDRTTGRPLDEIRQAVLKQVRSDRPEIINSDGLITLYHGTPNRLAIEKSGNFKPGTYFAADRKLVAEQYANKKGFEIIKTQIDPALLDYSGSGVFSARDSIALSAKESSLSQLESRTFRGNAGLKSSSMQKSNSDLFISTDSSTLKTPSQLRAEYQAARGFGLPPKPI